MPLGHLKYLTCVLNIFRTAIAAGFIFIQFSLFFFFNRNNPTCVLNIYRVVPNCVTKAKNVRTRIFIGDQIDDCKDLSGLYYLLPFQKVSGIAIKR